MKLLIVTTLKPMIGNFLIENHNSVLSWINLRIKPTVIVYGFDEGVPEFCKKYNIINKDIKRNNKNVPYISEILKDGYEFMGDKYDYIAYINGDILLKNDFCDTLEAFHKQFNNVKSCLLTAIRYNIYDYEKLDFDTNSWSEKLDSFKGNLDEPTGIDIFVHKKNNYINLPDFAIARFNFDSYMLNYAITHFDITVNMTKTTKIYHHYGLWYHNDKMVERKMENFDKESFKENKELMSNEYTIETNNINMCNYFTNFNEGKIYFIKNLNLFNDILIGNNIPQGKDLNEYLPELKYKTLPLLKVYYRSLTNIIQPLVENGKDINIIIPKTFEDCIEYKNNNLNTIKNNKENTTFLCNYIKETIEKYENLIKLTEKYSQKEI